MGSIVFVPEIYYKTETVRMDAKKAFTHPSKTNVPRLEIALRLVTPSLYCRQRVDLCYWLDEENK